MADNGDTEPQETKLNPDASVEVRAEDAEVGGEAKNLLESTDEKDSAVVKKETEQPQQEESEELRELTENVYSLMFVSSLTQPSFWYAMFVYCLQMTIIALLLWNLLDAGYDTSNPLSVPPGVAVPVRVAMALAIPLAVAYQTDMIVALVFLQEGYNEQVLEIHPYAARWKWIMSYLLQFTSGGGLLLVIFILIVQSDTVLGMMLNFAALAFISEIDDLAFSIAKHGFLSDQLLEATESVGRAEIPVARKLPKYSSRASFFILLACFMSGYGVIVHQQKSGKFLCQSILVQFGDGFNPAAATLSGVFEQSDQLISERVTYLERTSGHIMLGYCKDMRAWTLTLWLQDEDDSLKKNPCRWFARSPETDTFDLTTLTSSAWAVDTQLEFGQYEVEPAFFQYLFMDCVDCSGDNALFGCRGRGDCIDNRCVCNEGFFGTDCQFSSPCPSLAVDARTNDFPAIHILDDIANEYVLLQDESGEHITSYDKPVYVKHNGTSWSILMFIGRRWIATTSETIRFTSELTNHARRELPPNATRDDLVEFFDRYHAFFDPIPGIFISDPMDLRTPSNEYDPVGLGWYVTKSNSIEGAFYNEVDPSQPVGTVLLCSFCDDSRDNGCYFLMNNCSTTSEGVCDCADGFEGALCERQV